MGTVTYARHIYARAMASFEHCMIDSSVVSFIVHLLFNGDTGSFQTAPSARKCAFLVFDKVGVGAIMKFSIFGKRTRLFQCKFFRHPRLEFSRIAVRFKRNCRFVPQREARPIADVPLVLAAPGRDFATPGANLFPNREPLTLLIRQHISPRALFMQPRPCTPSTQSI